MLAIIFQLKAMDMAIDLPVYAEVLGRLKSRIANTSGALVDPVKDLFMDAVYLECRKN